MSARPTRRRGPTRFRSRPRRRDAQTGTEDHPADDRRPRGAGPRGHDARRRRQAGRRRDPLLLLRAEARPAGRRLPHVPGRDRGNPEAPDLCSTPVKDGMVVNTQTERVQEAQNAIVEFLLVNHPLDCPVCDKGGECPLQDITFGWGLGSRVIEPKRHFVKPLALSPLIAIDRERCILCYRCVRFSQEVAEDWQLIFTERGAHTFVGTHDGHPYVAPFSGNIIELCPVGALTSQPYRFRARPWDIEGAGGICTLCPSQCNVTFTVRDEKVLRVLARDHGEVDDGWLCDKGRFAYQAIHVDERITVPLVRDGGSLREVSWERALQRPPRSAATRGTSARWSAGRRPTRRASCSQRLMREHLNSSDLDSRRAARVDLEPDSRARGAGAAGDRPRPRVRPHRAACSAASRSMTRRSSTCGSARASGATASSSRSRAPVRARLIATRPCRCATSPARRPPSWAALEAPRSSGRRAPSRRRTATMQRAGEAPARRRRGRRDPLGRASRRRRALARAGADRRAARRSPGTRRRRACSRSRRGANGRGLREAGVLPNAGPGYAELAAPGARALRSPSRRRRRDHGALPATDRPGPRAARSRPVERRAEPLEPRDRPRLGPHRRPA